jgi:hypothetical protein
MKTFEHMDDYEKEIAKALSTHFSDRYTEAAAQKKVEEYYDVMERVGWYWAPEEWAEKLDYIIQQNISPEEWNHRIDMIDEYPDDPLALPKNVNGPSTLE